MPEARMLQDLRRAMEIPASGSSDFDLNPDVVLPANRKLRSAAVLLALVQSGDTLNVVLTKRSSALKHHAGQIALPGGKADEADEGAIDTALREAHEEIGLHPETVSVIGVLPEHETVTGFNVTPVVGLVNGEFVP
ncbi:MAG: CoA pyrophosphatase, partial [Paracoccaceae bacterium]